MKFGQNSNTSMAFQTFILSLCIKMYGYKTSVPYGNIGSIDPLAA